MDNPAASAALSASLADSDAWVRYFAVRGLLEHRQPASTDVLMRLAEHDPAAHVRIAALEALGALAVSDALPLLERLVDDEHHEVAAAALGALGAIDDPDGLPTLKDAIRAESPARRIAAVNALVVNGGGEAVESLEWACAADADPLRRPRRHRWPCRRCGEHARRERTRHRCVAGVLGRPHDP